MNEEKKQNNILEQAFAYHINGFSVMPVKKDKRPFLSSWKQYQTTLATDDEILNWFKNSNVNIAIITGKISNLTVVDIDNKVSEEQTSKMLALFPETYTVQTPSKGYHLYYQYQEGLTISANAYSQYPNVDIRGESGYVVAPPSKTETGEYIVLKNLPFAPFPINLFPRAKPKKTFTEMTTASIGNRNDTLASVIGKLLKATKEEEWFNEVLPAVQKINLTYSPPLPDHEVLTVFNSIVNKEKQNRQIVLSDGQRIPIMKNKAGVPYMNMSNVIAILKAHPDFRDKIRYNTFKQVLEIDGKELQDEDTLRVQHILQIKFGLHSITKDTVYSALVHCAYDNRYDEAQDWLKSLVWDGEKRLFNWLHTATNVEDNTYTRGVGTQWFIGMVNRIMNPGCIFDYMLVLVGGQGIGKTSLFRIIGGEWYKSFTGGIEGKDFYMQMRGAIIMDLDEGATLYKSEAIKIKSIITTTHDEFRAPYDRIPKKYPRHFVFSMSTNEIEPFRDATGNRRYWAVDIEGMVQFDWLKANREQLFAEALYWLENPSDEIPQVPEEEAKRIQEEHLPSDSWTELVCDEVRKSFDYCTGNPDYNTTIKDIFLSIFKDESAIRLDRKIEIRISTILKKELGLSKVQKMIDGDRKSRWYITPEKIRELQAKNQKKVVEPLEELVEELSTPNQLQF